MPLNNDPGETILIVDDEESVRKTFQEWLDSAELGCRILCAPDAEAALLLADQHTIDLAILDWNLGAGNDGLRLLEDLYLFNPDVAAILVTGFADQATPLDAMRIGVRDYLDKNQDLDRDTFLQTVQKQLERIRPAKRERRLHQGLVAFREAVEKILPLVESTAALNEPLSLPEAIRRLFQLLLDLTAAQDGVLVVHAYDPARQPAKLYEAYDASGNRLETELVPFERSLAGSLTALDQPLATVQLDNSGADLQTFERGRHSLLAAPLQVAPGYQVVVELFDKRDGAFEEADRRVVQAAAVLGAEVLRQFLAQRHTSRMLLEAVRAALGAGDSLAQSLRAGSAPRADQPPSAAVLEQLRRSLQANPTTVTGADEALRLAEAVRVLAVRHGPAAVHYCTRLIEGVRDLLEAVTGPGEGGS